MGGTGNFNRESKTLYLGGVKRPAGGGNLERVLKEVCEEYGPVEYGTYTDARAIPRCIARAHRLSLEQFASFGAR